MVLDPLKDKLPAGLVVLPILDEVIDGLALERPQAPLQHHLVEHGVRAVGSVDADRLEGDQELTLPECSQVFLHLPHVLVII